MKGFELLVEAIKLNMGRLSEKCLMMVEKLSSKNHNKQESIRYEKTIWYFN